VDTVLRSSQVGDARAQLTCMPDSLSSHGRAWRYCQHCHRRTLCEGGIDCHGRLRVFACTEKVAWRRKKPRCQRSLPHIKLPCSRWCQLGAHAPTLVNAKERFAKSLARSEDWMSRSGDPASSAAPVYSSTASAKRPRRKASLAASFQSSQRLAGIAVAIAVPGCVCLSSGLYKEQLLLAQAIQGCGAARARV